ncbi:DUF6524 family protein [Azospirillum agricola]|uniref:DUF6524 family protein n=1 Tax=Azospirillum agricola TaxID=1720247 RepID=UPI000A0EEC76|nr:DUF6524 family protein [Azospirillum agricola]MBP2229276.1 hypothetical protein [Azospirillum agricola]SMH60523.1 hypothetical protein SAMN02982994_5556 [Azospirillum lipoferum]
MLTIPGYIVRLLAAMLVIFGTYNPSGYSYYHWLQVDFGDWAFKLFVGLLLMVTIYLQANALWRSMRLVGSVSLTLVIVTAVWFASDLGLIDLSDGTELTLAIQIGLTALLGTGFSWSHIRYRLSGQVDSENITQ